MFKKLFAKEEGADLWQANALLWKDIQERKKGIEAEEKACREALIELAGNESAKGCGIRVTKYKRIGAVQYDKIPELQDIDLDSYRKPSMDAFRIMIEKSK